MSASRDKGQRIAFVYSNLYEIYRKGKEAAKAADLDRSKTDSARVFRAPAEDHPGLRLGTDHARILKSGDAHAPAYAQVRAHTPVNLISKRLEAARALDRVNAAAAPAARAISAGDTLRARIEAVKAERVEAERDPLRGYPARVSSESAVRDLKNNLKSLTELHSRLRFMLQELENLVKD